MRVPVASRLLLEEPLGDGRKLCAIQPSTSLATNATALAFTELYDHRRDTSVFDLDVAEYDNVAASYPDVVATMRKAVRGRGKAVRGRGVGAASARRVIWRVAESRSPNPREFVPS